MIEFNVRMGDPECQVILPRLKTDLLKIIINVVNNKLNKILINWKKKMYDYSFMFKRISGKIPKK